uniref:Uncharacterized protein n=1 Tax=Rhizophora mucronata TaxID=61149 RepID=A0A2P2NEZ7_RHIMU
MENNLSPHETSYLTPKTVTAVRG